MGEAGGGGGGVEGESKSAYGSNRIDLLCSASTHGQIDLIFALQ